MQNLFEDQTLFDQKPAIVPDVTGYNRIAEQEEKGIKTGKLSEQGPGNQEIYRPSVEKIVWFFSDGTFREFRKQDSEIIPGG